MAEKISVFSSKIGYKGVFSFKDFYKFCYVYLDEERGFDLSESEYKEKIQGNSKEVGIKWEGEKKLDDYFKHKIKVEFRIIGLEDVEVVQEGKKIKANKGDISVKLKGEIVKDYQGMYETKPFLKVIRNIYEKWIINSRVEQIEEMLIGDCDKFLEQAKAYLDLEGKK